MDDERQHPHDPIFTRPINFAMKRSSVQMAKLTYSDFKQIDFEPYYPSIILDFIEYCSGLKLADFFRAASEKNAIEKKEKEYLDKLKEAKL